MKHSEFFREIKKKGWTFLRQGKGSHEIWTNGNIQVAIPNHGRKELSTGLEKSLRKQMGL